MSIYINEGYLWESAKTKEVFSITNKLLKMQMVEAAIAKAEEEIGLIPSGIHQRIQPFLGPDKIDLHKFELEMTKTGGHPVVAFLRAWEPSMDPDVFKYIHYGATTQDIMDTALVLLLKDYLSHYKKQLLKLLLDFREKTNKYRKTIMAGRTHLQHAVPISFGQKWAVWLAEMQRHYLRLLELESRLYTASFYGAAGNLASLNLDMGLDVTKLVADELDLNYNPVPWHTSRDNIVELITLLTSISTTLGKIANECQILSRNEIGEVEEPWAHGNIGSSTMPQKRNAFGLQAMVALSRICQSQCSSVFFTNTHDHERDFKAYNVEEFSILSVCSSSEKILNYAIQIFEGLLVDEGKMRENINLTKGLIMSESLMMKLSQKFDRNTAHELIYEHAMRAFREGLELKSVILEDRMIMQKLTPQELEDALDPSNYLGANDQIINDAIASFDNFFAKIENKE